MATTSTQNFVRSALTDRNFPIDTTVAAGVINQGDLCYWTGAGAASLSTPGASNANAANSIGVAVGQYPIPVAAGITESNSGGAVNFPTNPTAPVVRIAVEGEFQFKATNGQTFAPLAAVYLGADGQTVSTTVLGALVGYVAPDQTPVGGTLGGSIVGTGTNYVVIHIKPAQAA